VHVCVFVCVCVCALKCACESSSSQILFSLFLFKCTVLYFSLFFNKICLCTFLAYLVCPWNVPDTYTSLPAVKSVSLLKESLQREQHATSWEISVWQVLNIPVNYSKKVKERFSRLSFCRPTIVLFYSGASKALLLPSYLWTMLPVSMHHFVKNLPWQNCWNSKKQSQFENCQRFLTLCHQLQSCPSSTPNHYNHDWTLTCARVQCQNISLHCFGSVVDL
jgi:hypothetical protein